MRSADGIPPADEISWNGKCRNEMPHGKKVIAITLGGDYINFS